MDEKRDIWWDKLSCQEASMFSKETYIPCGQPAIAIIWHNKDKRAYPMCLGCADHNVKNRRGIELARKDEEIIVKKELDFARESNMLINFIRDYVIKYFAEDNKLTREEFDQFMESKELVEILRMALSGKYKNIILSK
jgi:hypothetical protein